MMRKLKSRGAAAALVALVAASPAAGAQTHAHGAAFSVPESMRAEHGEIHEALEQATRAEGPVSEAARRLAAVLHPHFVREEQIALPPLALLRPLAQGAWSPEMREVLPMTDSLRAELPGMLREHEAIAAAALSLEAVARAAGNSEVEELARALQRHARAEEEIFYPAAVLVGDWVRARDPHAGSHHH